MSNAISRQENMTYSSLRRADTWSPSITHKEGRMDGVRWRHNQNFSDG